MNDLSDALRIGTQTQVENFLQLTEAGKVILIQANVLRPVEQLAILQGHSGLATTAFAAQAVGLMYGVIVRLAQDLHVSPIEAIAFVRNTEVLLVGVSHFFSSTCHRPLFLFLDAEKWTSSLLDLEGTPQSSESISNILLALVGGNVFLVGGVVMYFIIQSAKSFPFTLTKTMMTIGVGVILFIVVMGLMGSGKFQKLAPKQASLFVLPVPVLNAVGYIYALVVTVKYWDSEGFNTLSSSYLSKCLPYIG